MNTESSGILPGRSHAEMRRFTTLDAMILIMATAVGLGLARATFEEGIRLDSAGGIAALVIFGTTPCAASWSIACLVIRLRRPRPRRRRLVRQAGFQASIAASVSFALGVLPMYLPVMRSIRMEVAMVYAPAFVVVPSIVSLWLVQRMGGRWKTERCWVDRLGRVVAIVWLSSAGVFWVLIVATWILR
jgi:hypothetical protein